MDEWDFDCGTNDFAPNDDFFRTVHETHESCSPKADNLFSSIFGRLSSALERRKTFTIDYDEAFPQNNHNELEDEFLSEVNSRSQETLRNKKVKRTVPRSPKLRTRERLGLTWREKRGIKLNRQRKETKLTDTRRFSVLF